MSLRTMVAAVGLAALAAIPVGPTPVQALSFGPAPTLVQPESPSTIEKVAMRRYYMNRGGGRSFGGYGRSYGSRYYGRGYGSRHYYGGRRYASRHYPYRHHYYRHHHYPYYGAVALGFGLGGYYGYNDDYDGAYDGGYGGSHVEWCLNRYRSYDPSSDTFLGYDGYRHQCRGPY